MAGACERFHVTPVSGQPLTPRVESDVDTRPATGYRRLLLAGVAPCSTRNGGSDVSDTLDVTVTVVLFVALIPCVVVAIAIGLHLLMLGDTITDRHGSIWGVVIGVVGIPIAVIGIYLAAVVLAWRANGATFYYPVVALIVGGVATVGLSALAEKIARGR